MSSCQSYSLLLSSVKAGVVLWSCIAPDGGRGCVVPRVVLPRNQGALWQHPAGERGPHEHPTTAAPAGKHLILSPRLFHGPHVVGVSLSGPLTCVWHRLIPIQKHTVLAPLPTAGRRRQVISSSFFCGSVSAVSSESICLIPCSSPNLEGVIPVCSGNGANFSRSLDLAVIS